jgi:hypothetical protein
LQAVIAGTFRGNVLASSGGLALVHRSRSGQGR